MAKVPPPKGKGEPPDIAGIVGNLDKPESEALVPLNFKVPHDFKREYKTFCAQIGKPMVEVHMEAFALYKEGWK